jgi:hypothetical protein
MHSKLGCLLGSILLLAATACGGRAQPAASSQPQPLEIPRAQAVSEESAPALARAAAASSFAPSPLTPFADQVITLIGEVLAGQPPTKGPLPLIPWRDAELLVKSRVRAATPRIADLEFFVFAMELELVLSEEAQAPTTAPAAVGQPPAPGPPSPPTPEPGRMATIAFLSRAGLKIAKLDLRNPSRVQPLPPALEGAMKFGTEIFDLARQKTLATLLVGEPERPVLGNELLFTQMLKDLPSREEIERAEALASTKGELIGLRFDDIFVIARDARGEIWGFQLEIEEDHGKLAFETTPLVAVNRLELDQLR